jgi:DNA (cytosine-5)-methyltransferase 1
LQGFPSGWTKVASPAKSEEFDLDSPRYKALGNAVAVPVARWIAKRMKEKLEEPKTHSTMALDEIASSYGDFRDSSVRRMKLSKLHLSTKSNGTCLKWQSGGLVVGDECWDVRAPEAPSTPIQKKLIKIIERDHPSEKYFLSANAAEGILRRVYSQNRTLFGPMHEALERLIEREGVA